MKKKKKKKHTMANKVMKEEVSGMKKVKIMDGPLMTLKRTPWAP